MRVFELLLHRQLSRQQLIVFEVRLFDVIFQLELVPLLHVFNGPFGL